MKLNKEQLEKLATCKTAEDVIEAAKAYGIEIEPGKAEELLSYSQSGELPDDDLENVAGGCGDDTPSGPYCHRCGSTNVDHTWGCDYHCNECGFDWTQL